MAFSGLPELCCINAADRQGLRSQRSDGRLTHGQAVLTSLRRSGWRSNTLSSFTKASGGLVLPSSP